jgi:hypothetical protein
MRLAIVVCRRSWRENFSGSFGIFTRKKKKQKERTVGRGRPVETAQPWKSIKVAFGNFCLMISTAA